MFVLLSFLDPVILDPNFKTPNFQVSPDLTSATCSRLVSLNSGEKRPSYIFSSEGFISGVHTWQVDVEACANWGLGVVTESDKKLQKLTKGRSFLISCVNDKCSWAQAAPKIKKVCVVLDMGRKQVVFSDPDSNVTLTSYQFISTEKMYPYFFLQSPNTMNILPSKSRLA